MINCLLDGFVGKLTTSKWAKITKCFQDTAYQFAKTGLQAGQTVNHCHEHLIFTATKTQEFFSKLRVLKNMCWPASPLSKEELSQRVKALKKELSKAFL